MFTPKQKTAAHLMDAVMPFGEHLEELRKRLIYSLLGIAPILIVALTFSRPMVMLLIETVLVAQKRQNLPSRVIQTSPAETFIASLQLSIIATILVGSPWIIYQLWRFVAPGLYANERRFVQILLPLSGVLTLTGIVFLYKVVMPGVVSFFLVFGSSFSGPPPRVAPLAEGVSLPSYPVLEAEPPDPAAGNVWINTELRELRVAIADPAGNIIVLGSPLTKSASIAQLYKVSDYLGLFMSLAIAFALGFQTPVVVLLLGWMGVIEVASLRKYRRYVILICFIVGAVLTPPDPLSQIALALPLYALFELGGLLLRFMPAERVSAGFRRRKEGPDAGDE